MFSILLPILATACARMPAENPPADPPGAPPSSLTILPAAVGVEPGGQTSFEAKVHDKDGNPTAGEIQWQASGGTIDQNGHYTAPTEPGEYDVVATETLSHITATSTVVIDERPVTWIYPGQDIQQVVDSQAPGTEFLIKEGVHRLQSIHPKAGMIFSGDPGAVLCGAKLLTSFTREGSYWVATGQTQQSGSHGPCDQRFYDPPGSGSYTGCSYAEDLYIDDDPLFQVTSLGEVGSGRWYFDYGADRIYFADDPTGRKVEASVTARAFHPSANDVTIRNLTVEKYASPAQAGAIHGEDSHGWLIENCDVRLNHGAGIRLGHGMTIRNSNIELNGQIGLVGIGDDILVESSEIAWNNKLHYDAGWEAGGTKFVLTRNLVVRGNFVHHNDGPGLWTDIDNIDTLYEENEVTDNTLGGIFHEISYDAVIRNNVLLRNGTPGRWLYDAGILVAHSPNVEVYGNVVADNVNGITGIQQNRGSGAYGPHVLENLWVHDNTVSMTVGLTGLGQDVGSDAIYTSRNNRFDRNTYTLGSNVWYFHYDDHQCSQAEWVAYQQDLSGEFHY